MKLQKDNVYYIVTYIIIKHKRLRRVVFHHNGSNNSMISTYES